jgi:putative colanic acid biosynthesis acetyltransferase WcaF
MQTTRLKKNFNKKDFQAGASIFKQMSWYMTNLLFFRSGILPFSSLLVFLLRSFGARIGKDVRIKPCIYIKYPWKLTIGDHSWLADCYIENLDQVYIGDHVCISQQAMLLTGNHDYKNPAFDLITKPVTIENGAWICANSTVTPGIVVGTHAVLTTGSTIQTAMRPYAIYQGNPAKMIRTRHISDIKAISQ